MTKSILIVTGYLCCLVLMPSCTPNESKEVKIEISEKVIEGKQPGTMAAIELEGMTCQIGCANHIKNKLAKMEGVLSADVLFEESTARISYDEKIITEKDLINAIEKMQDGQYSVIKVEVERTVKKAETISLLNKTKQQVVSGKERLPNSNSTEKVSYQPQIKPVVFPNIFNLFRLFMPEK